MLAFIATLIGIIGVVVLFGFLPGLAVGALYHEQLLEKDGTDK